MIRLVSGSSNITQHGFPAENRRRDVSEDAGSNLCGTP